MRGWQPQLYFHLISSRRFSKTLVIGHYMTEDARSATVLGQDLDRLGVGAETSTWNWSARCCRSRCGLKCELTRTLLPACGLRKVFPPRKPLCCCCSTLPSSSHARVEITEKKNTHTGIIDQKCFFQPFFSGGNSSISASFHPYHFILSFPSLLGALF